MNMFEYDMMTQAAEVHHKVEQNGSDSFEEQFIHDYYSRIFKDDSDGILYKIKDFIMMKLTPFYLPVAIILTGIYFISIKVTLL